MPDENKITLDLGDIPVAEVAVVLERAQVPQGCGYSIRDAQVVRMLAAQVRNQIPRPPLPEPVQWCVVQEDAPGAQFGQVFVHDCGDPDLPWVRIGAHAFINRRRWDHFVRPVILWPFSKKQWDQ